MKKVIIDYGKKELYNFILSNYPWDYGSYDYFKWKHLLDPYCNKPDFYVIKDDNDILAMCVGRRYVYNFNGKQFQALCMMDFTTEKKYRLKGLITELSEHVKSDNAFDITLGFSSEDLYNKVYSKLNCFQRYYTYQFCTDNTPHIEAEEVQDIEYICKKINSTKNSLHLNKTPEYMNYLCSSPKYPEIRAAQYEGLLILICIKNDEARVLDMSEYSLDSCRTAVQIALNFANTVSVDFPQEISCGNGILKKITCCISDDFHPDSTLQKGDDFIWIPVTDRK